MFTGIITEVGRLAALRPIANGVELSIEAPRSVERLTLGASIAINGVCQTVTALAPPRFTVQAVGATLDRTTLGRLPAGARVNLEPSLRLGDELGGHLVMGHVHGVGRVESVEPKGEATFLTVSLPRELAHYAALRGSISLDGVSLTVAGLAGSHVTISVIPHTLSATIFEEYRPGTPVNVEVDLVARYLERLLHGGPEGSAALHSSVTLDLLKEKFS